MSSEAIHQTFEFPEMRALHWSHAEKAVAGRAFERALQAERQEILQEARRRSAELRDTDQLWELEAYLKRSRERIDKKYDFRYSVLPEVLGVLISEGRVSQAELEGLGDDKLHYVNAAARMMSGQL